MVLLYIYSTILFFLTKLQKYIYIYNIYTYTYIGKHYKGLSK
jgi:hypothetical protein